MEPKIVKDECFDDLMYRMIIEIWTPMIGVIGLNDGNIKELESKLSKFPDLSKENKKAIVELLKLKTDNSPERVDRNITKACVRALEKLEIRLTHEEQFLQKRVEDLEKKIEALHATKTKDGKKPSTQKTTDEAESDISIDTAY